MHNEFRKLLEKAKGRSEFVIAVNMDIRGFTPFCQSVDGPLNVATYITRIYSKIINEYFKDASYYKPTGDGLIIIIPYDTSNLKEKANSTIERCLKLLTDFPNLVKDDPMIYFETPEKIGIGIARGSACCIFSEGGDKVLDYSGRILNLASRLMELARPSGVVVDSSFRSILNDEFTKDFAQETVYVRGLAEEKPLSILYTTKYSLISAFSKKPMKEPKWDTVTSKTTLGKLENAGIDVFYINLKKNPFDTKQISLEIVFDDPKGTDLELSYYYKFSDARITYRHIGKRHQVVVYIKSIIENLKESGVTENAQLQFCVYYSVND